MVCLLLILAPRYLDRCLPFSEATKFYHQLLIAFHWRCGQSLVESTVGKDVIREGSWNPEKPNRLVLTLRGGVKVRSNFKNYHFLGGNEHLLTVNNGHLCSSHF